MYSVWNSVLSWVLFCLFSSITMEDTRPIVIEEPTTTTTTTNQEGSCVTIKCKYKYQKELKLLWIKDPKWIEKEKRYDGIIVYSNTDERPQVAEYSNRVEFFNDQSSQWTNCTIKIQDLKKNDSGNYTFRYIGSDKYISNTFLLTVVDNPCKVHIKPANLNKSLKEGDRVSLQCATSAACEFHPLWQSSGSSEILKSEQSKDEVEKRSELHLTVNWTDDGRTLTCRPSRSNDNCLERRVTLRVEYAPKETKVIESSSSKDVKEGEQVTISCSSKARPNANFTWIKHQSSFSRHGQNLTLYNMKPEDEGKFYCLANNEHGSEKSNDIKIKVIYAPKGVDIDPKLAELKEGDRLTLTCLVQNSNPEVDMQSYRWYKDGQEINQQTMNTFTVPSVRQRDKGVYQCQARNSVGETMSTHITQVSVKYTPQNTFIDGTSGIKLGFELNLKCVTEAEPVPHTYSWYFKPEHEQQFVTLSHTDEMYRIEKVAVSNAGLYKCSAQNDVGKGANSTEKNVLVFYPPKTPNLTMKEVVKEEELYTITCTVESSPQATLTLSRSSLTNPEKDIITVQYVQSNILKFAANATVSDAGMYTCEAENTEGKTFSKNQLKVLYAPKNVTALADPGVELKEGSNLTLTCKADSVPEVSAYTWMKSSVTHSETVGHGQKITLHFLKSSDSDHYFCISRNEIGSAKSSSIFIRVKYRPRITLNHNMTSLGLWEKAVPIHLSCNVQCDPPATFFAWYKMEENTTVLSNNVNYTVQPQNPGMYYCYARNEEGESRSEPVKIFLNHFIIKQLVQVIISLLVIVFLIGVIFLIQRIILRKRSAQRSFFFSAAPLCFLSNLGSSDSRNNTRENLVMEGSTELSGFSDNHSVSAVQSNHPANRNIQAGRPNSNIHTVYDAIKLPPSKQKQHHTEEDLTMTTVNYAMLQFVDSSNPNKSVPSHDGSGPVYAEVSKNKQMAKKLQDGHADYENVSGVCAAKRPFPNINWDSDSSESEEEVNYTKVSFTVTAHHNTQMDVLSSDEEDKTEYSEVKI
ncbi:B-cell receptor CD22 isoform X6 [Ictalurus punctatus]|uniref:B-cell receptor CD22 n=1 Tax=Ictalurus punctatus TaxID=7998 RepID=A0A2D0SUV4_ICTPU|nr:B-cell receptor CD22 isoform X6 [Ictalurus punctatus]